MYLQNLFTNHIFNIHVKRDLVLNNQQWLICHKTKPKPKTNWTVNNTREKMINHIHHEKKTLEIYSTLKTTVAPFENVK